MPSIRWFHTFLIHTVIAGSVLLLSCVARPARAQSDEEASDRRYPKILQGDFLNKKSRLYLDADGLPTLSNLTLEELLALSRLLDESTKLPTYTIESVDLRGRLIDDRFQCELAAKILLGDSQQVATLALGLKNFHLTSRPSLESLDDANQGSAQRFGVDENEEYQWFLRGAANSRYEAKLQGVALVRKQRRNSVTFNLPSTPRSRLELLLPSNSVEIRLEGDGVLEQEATPAGLKAVVIGRGGDVTLSWREQRSETSVSAIRATSTTRFDIAAPQQAWTASTQLQIRWFGSDASNEVSVALPPNADWLVPPTASFESYEIYEEREIDDNGSSNTNRRLRIVNLDILQNDSIEILLEWEFFPPAQTGDQPSLPTKIFVPRVLGVDEHQGSVRCVFPGSYAALYSQSKGVQLIEQIWNVEDFGNRQLKFRFPREDFQFALEFRRNQSIPTVRPTYHVRVDGKKLRMTAWLDCTFDPQSQIPDIGLVMGDWSLEENNVVHLPQGLSSPDSAEVLDVRLLDNGDYVIQSKLTDSSFGNRRIRQLWRFEAERTWDAEEENALEFLVPTLIRGGGGPEAIADHGSGVLIVSSENSVLLTQDLTASVSLVPDTYSKNYLAYGLQESSRTPSVFRFQSGVTVPKWSGTATFLPQLVSYSSVADIEILPRELLIKQNFDLRVANESLKELRIQVSKAVNAAPQVEVNGILTALLKINSEDDTVNTYQVLGATELLGDGRVSIITKLPWGVATSQDNNALAANLKVPLASLELPSSSRRISNRWMVKSDISLESVASTLHSSTNDMALPLNRLLDLPPTVQKIPLRIATNRTQASPLDTLIQREWLQTTITSQERRERYAVRIASTADQLDLSLPPLAQLDRVAINGVQLAQADAPYDYSSHRLTVKFPSRPNQDETPTVESYTVELFYSLPDGLSWINSIDVVRPRIENVTSTGSFTWQLVTPSTQHLLINPGQLTADWEWRWSGFWWYRHSIKTQAELEQQLVASTQMQLPQGANKYLFADAGGSDDFSALVAARFVLWLPIGLLTILITSLCLSMPSLRRPLNVMLGALSVGLLATIWPDLAMLLAQTAFLSIGLVVMILITQASIDTRFKKRTVFANRPSVIGEGSERLPTIGSKPGSTVGRQEQRPLGDDGGYEVTEKLVGSSVSPTEE